MKGTELEMKLGEMLGSSFQVNIVYNEDDYYTAFINDKHNSDYTHELNFMIAHLETGKEWWIDETGDSDYRYFEEKELWRQLYWNMIG